MTRIGFDDNPRDVFRTDDSDFHFMEEVFAQFGPDENDCFVVVQAEQLFSAPSISDLRNLSAEIADVDGVTSVLSFADPRLVVFDPLPRPLLPNPQRMTDAALRRAESDALAHPLVSGLLLSEDARYALLMVRMRRDELTIDEMQPAIKALWEIAQRWTETSTLEVQLTGIPAIRVEAFNLVREQTASYTAWGVVVGVTVVLLLMRRLAAVFVVLSAAGVGALWTIGALGIVGEPITIFTTVLPMLVLIIGLTDAVHLAFDIRESRSRGVSPIESARGALRHLTGACLLTSITTVLGFGSLAVTDIDIIRRFGLACAAGCGLAFFAVITVVPLLASSRIGLQVLPPRGGKSLARLGVGLLDGLADWTLRYRWSVTAAGIVLATLMLLFATGLSPENEISENLPDDARSMVALRTVDAQFGGMLPVFVVVDWPEEIDLSSPELKRVLERVHQVCEQHSGVNQPLSILNVMRAVPGIDPRFLPPELLRNLVHVEGHRAVVVVRAQDLGSSYLRSAFADLSLQLDDLGREIPGYRFRLTGSAVFVTGIIERMITDLASSLGLATVFIFGTMAVACRSIRIGLICLLPNAVPLLVTASLLLVFDGTLRFAAVVVFSVCLGIAVDDTIHLVSRFQRELNDCGDVDTAVRRSVRAVGLALSVTTTILVIGLSIPIGSDVPANRMFAALSCVAVAAAFVCDLVLLPAMLACFVRSPQSDGK